MAELGLIGGVPSSGSTLLMRLLSCLPGFACLPETGLFAHGQYFMDFDSFDPTCADLGLAVPWLDTGAKVRALGVSGAAWADARSRYRNVLEFAGDRLAVPGCLLVEKTPENVFAFPTYLDRFPEARVVVTSRDALGVVQSLMRRGFSMEDALLIWFGHAYAVCRLLAAHPERVFHCRYAELTGDPGGVSAAVAAHLQQGREVDAPGACADRGRLIEASCRTLETTAWTHSVRDPVAWREPVNYLGNRFRVLFRRTAFEVAPGRYARGRDMERFLNGEAGDIETLNDDRMRPIAHQPGSLMTRTLLATHAPCAAGG